MIKSVSTKLFFFHTGAVTNVSIKGPPAISEGLSVTLTCTATCNNGTCDYSWLRSNSKIESSNSYSIPNVNRADAGTYVCKVIDLVDKAESTDSHTLTVHCKCMALINNLILHVNNNLMILHVILH